MATTCPTSIERASRYLDRCPAAISGQGGHNATFRVACALVHGFGLDASPALNALSQWNARCVPPWSESELRHKITSAMATASRKPRGWLLGHNGRLAAPLERSSLPLTRSAPPPRRKVAYSGHALACLARRLPGADYSYFKSRSPLCPETQTPASFLHRLYYPGEQVLVFVNMKSQGQCLCEFDDEPTYDAGLLDHLVHGCKKGVWFLCNPVDGLYHPNPRLNGKRSRRSEESVTSWRFLVIESDKADALPWLAFLAQVPLPISAVYTSGRKSIHALVRLDGSSKADWDARAAKLKPILTLLGADPGAITAVRLTRLPGCYRGEDGPPAPAQAPARKRLDEPLEFDANGAPILVPEMAPPAPLPWTGGKLQELLYLDPAPDGSPICARPIRPVSVLQEV